MAWYDDISDIVGDVGDIVEQGVNVWDTVVGGKSTDTGTIQSDPSGANDASTQTAAPAPMAAGTFDAKTIAMIAGGLILLAVVLKG